MGMEGLDCWAQELELYEISLTETFGSGALSVIYTMAPYLAFRGPEARSDDQDHHDDVRNDNKCVHY